MSKKQFLEKAIASLKLLRKKALSDNERAFLMSFPGGGILKECGVFTDADKPQWLKDGRAELQELLDCHEWSSLQNAGMQNAHYTAPGVRQVMWEAVTPILRENDRILDPGCGIGQFYIEMPRTLNLTYVGIEKDCVSCAIAKLAHPEANIYQKDFLKWSYPQQFNLVIGNVPFTNGVQSMNLDGEWLRIGLHAQFFVNAIAHLAPSGLLAFLTSVSTLDARTPDYIRFREWVHRKCEFLGAVRLPNQGTHDGGTEVTTDLILLRRRESDCSHEAEWIGVGKSHIVGYDGRPAYLSNWYLANPQYLIGDAIASKLRGKNGNPTTTFALQPRPNQDVLGDLRAKIHSLLNPKCQEVKKMIGEVWSLESIDDPNFKNLSKFYVPHGFFALWETCEQGEWFVVDEYDANIKLDDDARGKRTFAGDDAYTVALKAYNWYLSDQVGDYYSTYPWVGKRAKAFCVHDKEIVKGIITLVNPDGEGVSHVCIVTPDGEEHTCYDWEFIEESNQQFEEQIEMATVIPADKFEKDSIYSFILRENPEKRGIEIHFPPECKTDSENAIAFIAKIIGAGFKQANKNPKLYYATYTPELIAKARSWVNSCKTFGAYELGSNEPVEKTPSRRRYPPKEPAAVSTAPAAPNKLLDALAPRLVADIASLLDNKIDPLAENIAACIVDRLKSERRDSQELDKLKAENVRLTAERDAVAKDFMGLTQMLNSEREQLKRMQESYCDLENKNKLLSTYCDDAKAQLAISGEALEQKAATIAQLRLECGQMRSQLQEFGLEPESESSAPTFDDDSEPQFADESEEESKEPVFADESDKPRFDDEEESGFDFDALEGK